MQYQWRIILCMLCYILKYKHISHMENYHVIKMINQALKMSMWAERGRRTAGKQSEVQNVNRIRQRGTRNPRNVSSQQVRWRQWKIKVPGNWKNLMFVNFVVWIGRTRSMHSVDAPSLFGYGQRRARNLRCQMWRRCWTPGPADWLLQLLDNRDERATFLCWRRFGEYGMCAMK